MVLKAFCFQMLIWNLNLITYIYLPPTHEQKPAQGQFFDGL